MKITIAIGMVLAVIRCAIGGIVPPEEFSWVDAYKDVAHLYMGYLAALWWTQGKDWQFRLFVWLCWLEVTVAVVSRA